LFVCLALNCFFQKQESKVEALDYRCVALGGKVPWGLQLEYWDQGQLPSKMSNKLATKDFVWREGTCDPYLYGPLSAFIVARKKAKKVMKKEFFSSHKFLISLSLS
jgi:hypothetical protein